MQIWDAAIGRDLGRISRALTQDAVWVTTWSRYFSGSGSNGGDGDNTKTAPPGVSHPDLFFQ